MSRTSQRGFTLIELVVVIVILGILAAFAVPRFLALDSQARIASTRGVEGSLRSASALTHSMWMAQGGGNVAMEGANITMVNGYPDRDNADDVLQPGTVANTPGRYQLVTVGANEAHLQLRGARVQAGCYVRYVEAAPGGSPTIQAINTGNNSC